jgi:hypothetical protein
VIASCNVGICPLNGVETSTRGTISAVWAALTAETLVAAAVANCVHLPSGALQDDVAVVMVVG